MKTAVPRFRLFLDDGYLALVTIFGVSGIVGITATASSLQKNLMGITTCNCVPSTLVRFQELCVVLLVGAIVLIPIGMIRSKGEEGQRPHIPKAFQGTLPSGREYQGSPIKNGGVLVLGVALVVLGVGVVAPSVLVLKNPATLAEGIAMIILGIFFVYRGGRPS